MRTIVTVLPETSYPAGSYSVASVELPPESRQLSVMVLRPTTWPGTSSEVKGSVTVDFSRNHGVTWMSPWLRFDVPGGLLVDQGAGLIPAWGDRQVLAEPGTTPLRLRVTLMLIDPVVTGVEVWVDDI